MSLHYPFEKKTTLFVYWNLIDLDFNTQDHEPCIFFLPHINKIVEKLFDKNYDNYSFILTGSHIFEYSQLKKIVDLILERENTKVILKFGIEGCSDYNREILNNYKNERLKFNACIKLDDINDIDQFIDIYNDLLDQGVDVDFVLNTNNKSKDEIQKSFLNKINNKYLQNSNKLTENILKRRVLKNTGQANKYLPKMTLSHRQVVI